jgi:DNA adenine methylase
MKIMKPFLKWVGGKTQIIDTIMESFPTTIVNYHEPFVGGGSVLLALLSRVRDGEIKVLKNIYASDSNKHLIQLFRVIQTSPEEFIKEMEYIIGQFIDASKNQNDNVPLTIRRNPSNLKEAQTCGEAFYYWIRKQFNNEHHNELIKATMFLFLNKTCFRGVHREGPNGFNVPFGHYKNPTIMDSSHIREISQLIQPVIFKEHSFEVSLAGSFDSGDFVYLDPPYVPESSKSFVGYNKNGFNLESHKKLFQICNELETRFLMSNSNAELVRNSFLSNRYTIHLIECRRSINSKNPESTTIEVLISNQISSQ